jgi:hypothetical protein
MPVFISYSHRDKEFVDQLATHLIKNDVYVWIDRWELAAGDSLIQRIQGLMKDASALLVILSKASVESEWCKKELSYGLVRELEERRVVVIPVLVEDCAIPPFLKDKLYVDFRTDFDRGLGDVLKAVAKHTSSTLGRTDPSDAEYFHDWGVSYGYLDDRVIIEIVAVTHSNKYPYTVLTILRAFGNEAATMRYRQFESHGFDWVERKAVVFMMNGFEPSASWKVIIDDSLPVNRSLGIKDSKSDVLYDVQFSVRRLGTDTGMGILFDVKPILEAVLMQMESARRNLSKAEHERLMGVIHSK